MSEKETKRLSYQHFIKRYIRCVRALDENIGRVLDYLDKNGLSDNTIVIYTADQGYWLGQNGFYDKRLIYDVSMAMPLLVRYPGVVKPGTTCDSLSMNIDFPVTLLDAAGLPVPAAMQGRSLMPLLRGKRPEDWRKEVFYAYWARPPHYGIRTDRYKLIHIPGNGWELLDLRTDPEEMRNQINNPEYRGVLADMKKRLEGQIIQTKMDPKHLPPNDPFSRQRGD